jgi:enolase-phosphatase E1
LASLITGWFDLTTAGVKPESLSCRTISEVIGAHRPGEPNLARPPHRWVQSFADIELAQQ